MIDHRASIARPRTACRLYSSAAGSSILAGSFILYVGMAASVHFTIT
jgi:hypothetical protein